MLKIHGSSQSRTSRCLWAAEEVGVKYEQIPTPVPEAKSPAHLKLNPNGHIPVIDDDGFVLYESMAINFYLAAKYGKAPLWPESIQDRALANQWSYWAMLEVEPSLVVMLQNVFAPPDKKNPAVAAEAAAKLKAPLAVIEQHLSNREYLREQGFHHRRPRCGIGLGHRHDGRAGFLVGTENDGMADQVHRAPRERTRPPEAVAANYS